MSGSVRAHACRCLRAEDCTIIPLQVTSKSYRCSGSATQMHSQADKSNGLEGSALSLVLYDVCEEIQLDQLRTLLAAERQRLPLKHPAAEQVRIENPPVVEHLGIIESEGGEKFETQIKYYDYGVVSIIFRRPLEGDWQRLIDLSANWISGSQFDQMGRMLVRRQLDRVRPALVKPYAEWLSEDYFIFSVTSVDGSPDASTLLAERANEIVQIIRGEESLLSASEKSEVLQSSISYYPNDVAVIGWNAALVYDTPSGSATAIQMLEYANSQLLEFRHYDEFLTRELNVARGFIEPGKGLLARWRLARAAARLQAVALDVAGLTERVDNAIKFLSDMFSARLYRHAANRVGVPDYKSLVDEKLATARELYTFMIEEFHQGRTFILELIVVIILIIELVFLFRGR